MKRTILSIIAVAALSLNSFAANPITFADALVKSICVAKWDTNDDGQLSTDEAAAVTSLDKAFADISSITSFDELQYFTGLESLLPWEFGGCSSLTSITMPSGLVSIGDFAFSGCTSLTSVKLSANVTDIGNYAFQYCTSLVSLQIPSGVTTIKSGTFNGCSELVSVNIPEGVTDIGDQAFRGCNKLASVTFPENLNSIGWSAFRDCTNLPSLTLPSKLYGIDDYAFAGCTGLRNVTVHCVLSGNLGLYYFEECSNMEVVIDCSTAQRLFVGCDFLKKVTLTDCVTAIDNGAFRDCTGLTEVILPESLTDIDNYAFQGCTNLVSVTSEKEIPFDIDDSVFSSETYAGTLYVPAGSKNAYQEAGGWKNFLNVKGIEVESPQTVTAAQEDNEIVISFSTSATNLTGYQMSLYLPEGVTLQKDEDDDYLYTLSSRHNKNHVFSVNEQADGGLLLVCYSPTKKTIATGDGELLRLPISVAATASGTLQAQLKTIKFSDISSNVTQLSDVSFNITAQQGIVTPSIITFADSETKRICVTNWDTNGDGELDTAEAAAVSNIGTVFQQAEITSFDELQYFTGLTSIGDMAFALCQQLTSIVIPKNVANVGGGLFYYCDALTSVNVVSDNTNLDSRSNCNAIIETATGVLLAGCKTTVIPYGVTAIGFEAFYHVHGLTNLPIPQSVTSIEDAGLFGVVDMPTLVIPKSVTQIGIEAIGNCNKLTSLTVETGNTVYDSRDNCNAIIETATNMLIAGCKSTVIPSTVTSIDFCAFDVVPINSLHIPASVKTIDDFAVRLCESLTSLTVDAANTIYDSRGNCNAIMETATDKLLFGCPATEIPAETKSIGTYAFYGYKQLTSVSLPRTVTAIGSHAFDRCSSLTSVTAANPIPVDITANTFTNRFYATLYVPTGSKTLYEAADYWKDFYDIVEVDMGGEVNQPDSLGIGETLVCTGEQTTMSINLNNEDEIIMVEFYMQLPEGLHILTDDDGYFDAILNSDRIDRTHQLEVEQGSDGLYHFLAYSSKNKPFKGNDGELISIRLGCDEGVTAGLYQGLLKNILLSDADKNAISLPNLPFTIEVFDYILGDVNDDRRINGMDIVEIVDLIMSQGYKPAADLYPIGRPDGVVNGMDLVEEVELVMSQTAASSRMMAANNSLEQGLVIEGTGNEQLAVGVITAGEFIMAQALVTMSDGMSLDDVTSDYHHVVAWRQLTADSYVVIAYSSRNQAFTSNESLFNLHCSGTGRVTVSNVLMADADKQEHRFAAVSSDLITGIDQIENEKLEIDNSTYDLQGRKVSPQLRKGVYIINGTKKVVK